MRWARARHGAGPAAGAYTARRVRRAWLASSSSSSTSSSPAAAAPAALPPPPPTARTSMLFVTPLWQCNLLQQRGRKRGKAAAGRDAPATPPMDRQQCAAVARAAAGLFARSTAHVAESVLQRYASAESVAAAANNEFFEHQMRAVRATLESGGGGGESGDSGVLVAPDLARVPQFDALCRVLWDCASWYARDSLGYPARQAHALRDTHQMLVWASCHGDVSGHPQHVHEDALMSGVFYANLPSTGGRVGDIVFADPRGASPFAGAERDDAAETAPPPFDAGHRVKPTLGDVLVFPPWLPHRVEAREDAAVAAAAAQDDAQYNVSSALLDMHHDDPDDAAHDRVDALVQDLRVSVSFNVLGSWRPTAGTQVNLRQHSRLVQPSAEAPLMVHRGGALAPSAQSPRASFLSGDDDATATDLVAESTANAEWAQMIERMRSGALETEHRGSKRVKGLGGGAEYLERPHGMPSRRGKD